MMHISSTAARVVAGMILATLAGTVSVESAAGQQHPVLNAPVQPLPEYNTPDSSVVFFDARAATVHGALSVAVPAGHDSITVFLNGFTGSDVQLVADTIVWTATLTDMGDSLVVALDSVVVDSVNVAPDSIRIPFQADNLRYVRRQFDPAVAYAINYPDLEGMVFPQAGSAASRVYRIVHPQWTTGSFATPGAFASTIIDSVAYAVVETRRPISPVGFYWAAGALSEINDRVLLASNSPVRVRYLFSDVSERDVLRAFGSAPESIRFFNDRLGLIPPNGIVTIIYSPIVEANGLHRLNGLFGGSLSGQNPHPHSDVLRTASAVAFEHVGRYGATSPADSWLFTGFPTYLGALFLEDDQGSAAFDSLMLELADDYFSESTLYERSLFHDRWHHPVDVLDAHAFSRGAWTAHMLRQLVGPERFADATRELADSGILSSDNLTQILEPLLADRYEPLQRELLYSAGHLRLVARWEYRPASRTVELRLGHEDTDRDWPLVPIDIEIETLTGTERQTIDLANGGGTFEIAVKGRPRYLTLDPDQKLLMESTIEQPVAAWVAQLRNGRSLATRVKAARALKDFRQDPALLIGLKSALRDESRAQVRSAILETVGAIPPNSAARQTLLEALADGSSRVRLAAIRSLRAYGSDGIVESALLTRINNERHEAVLAALVTFLAESNAAEAGGIVASALITDTPANLVRMSGLLGLRFTGEREEIRQTTRRYLVDRYPGPVRAAALRLLAHIASESDLKSIISRYIADRDAEVRLEAVSLVTKSIEADEGYILAALATEADPTVRKRMRWHLFSMNSGSAD